MIGGYTEPEGSRKHFGALLVGFYEGKSLKFAGRVGTGFSEKLLRSLFDALQGFARRQRRHLLRLTDSTGMLQHVTFTIPNCRHGYGTDDNQDDCWASDESI